MSKKRYKDKRDAVYRKRDRYLKRLGFSSYKEFLMSEHWKETRRNFLKGKKMVCKKCGDRGTEIHHLRYTMTTLALNSKIGLVLLCHGCHRKISQIAKEKKTNEHHAYQLYNPNDYRR